MPFARIVVIGQIFMIALISMGNILRVQGWPVLAFFIMFASNLLNAGLAAWAVFGLHWGVAGTALATALSQAAGCMTVIAVVQSKHSTLHIRRQFLRKDGKLARAILTLGVPFGVMQLLATLVFLAANHGAGNQGGTRGVAALGVLNTVAVLLIYPPMGVMQAMQPLVGFNKGAGQPQRVRAILLRVLATTICMGAVFSVLVMLFSHPIAALFSRTDTGLIALVQYGLPWFVVPITLFGLSGTMSHYFLSVHKPLQAGTLLLGRQLLAIPLFLLLPRWLGFSGVYLVAPCADLPFALVASVLLVRELRALAQQTKLKLAAPQHAAAAE